MLLYNFKGLAEELSILKRCSTQFTETLLKYFISNFPRNKRWHEIFPTERETIIKQMQTQHRSLRSDQ
jgi:hypothetical protein